MKELKLTKGYIALVDDEDYEYLKNFKWRANVRILVSGRKYVKALRYKKKGKGRYSTISLHRTIYEYHNIDISDKSIDHIDNSFFGCLDNRKTNLRLATHYQQKRNSRKITMRNGKQTSSIYKGVFWNTENKKWVARIRVNKQSKHLGYFTEEIEAAKAYNSAALTYFGEFAKINEI